MWVFRHITWLLIPNHDAASILNIPLEAVLQRVYTFYKLICKPGRCWCKVHFDVGMIALTPITESQHICIQGYIQSYTAIVTTLLLAILTWHYITHWLVIGEETECEYDIHINARNVSAFVVSKALTSFDWIILAILREVVEPKITPYIA